MSSAGLTGLTITPGGTIGGIATGLFSNTVLSCKYYSPKLLADAIPETVSIPFSQVDVQEQVGSVIASEAWGTITTNSFVLQQIPSKLVLWVRPRTVTWV